MGLSPIKITIDAVDKFSKEFSTIQKRVKNLQKGTQAVGKGFTRNVTLPIAAGLGFTQKASYEFTKSMNTIQAKTQEANAPIAKLRRNIKDMGFDMKMSARHLSAGGEFLAQANYNTKQINKSLPTLAKLSIATNTPLAETADITSNVVAAFGETPKAIDKFSTAFAYAAAKANTNLIEMGEAFKDAGPAANALGFTVESLSAGIGVLADNNIKGSKATTTLKNIVLELASNADALEAIGIPIMDADDKARGFHAIMKDIGNKMVGMSRTAKLNALEGLFSKRAVAGALVLVQDAQKIDSRVKVLTDTMEGFTIAGKTNTKVLDDMFNTIKQGSVGVWDNFISSVDNIMVELGDSGAFDPILSAIDSLTNVTKKFVRENPGMVKALTTMAMISALVGPIFLVGAAILHMTIMYKAARMTIAAYNATAGKTTLLMKIKTAAMWIYAGAVKVARVAVAAFTIGMKALKWAMASNPFILAGIAVVALGVLIYENWDIIKKFFSWLGDKLGALIQTSWEKIKRFFSWFLDNAKSIGKVILKYLIDPFQMVKDAVGGLSNLFGTKTTVDVKTNEVKTKTVEMDARGGLGGATGAQAAVATSAMSGVKVENRNKLTVDFRNPLPGMTVTQEEGEAEITTDGGIALAGAM